jgi:hypothetical protein
VNFWKKIGISVFIVAALVVGGLAEPALARDFRLATSAPKEPFTALYFTDPHALPVSVTKGKPQTVHFTIENHQSAPMTYMYHTTLTGNRLPIVGTKTITLAPEQSADLPLSFTATESGETLEVIVELPQQGQSIHFWSKS